jgi:hypothetical protein
VLHEGKVAATAQQGWKHEGQNGVQCFYFRLRPSILNNYNSNDRIALFGELSLEEAMDLSKYRLLLESEQ